MEGAINKSMEIENEITGRQESQMKECLCETAGGETFFCHLRLGEKRSSEGVREEEEQAWKGTEMRKRLMVLGGWVGFSEGGGLQSTVVDFGSAEGDIIPRLLPQEIRSQWEPPPSGERRLFQPRCTSTQMNAFIYRHAQTGGCVAMCEGAFPIQFMPSKVSTDNGIFTTQPFDTHLTHTKVVAFIKG